MDEDANRERVDERATPDRRLPYRRPVLTVIGPVASLTNSFNRAGGKDGGPNNTKT